MAGDNAKFEKTYVCDNSGYATQAIAALSIESDSLHIYNDFNLAWKAVGKELEVTKADGNIIYEIDGENAIKVFDKYIKTRYLHHYNAHKSRPTISIEFPFILKRGDIEITRFVVQMNEDGSVQCTAEVQIGDKLQFSYTNSEQIIRSGLELSYRITQKPVETIFIYSCMARRRFMDENIRYDIEPLTKIAPLSGFYSYGEIFTTPTSVEATGHTMTILALSEDDNIYTNNIDTDIKLPKSAETLIALTNLLSNIHTTEAEKIFDYDSKAMHLTYKSQVIKLSRSKSKLFEILYKNKNSAIHSYTICNYVWGVTSQEFKNDSLRTLIKKLRKKLPIGNIENIYGGITSLLSYIKTEMNLSLNFEEILC